MGWSVGVRSCVVTALLCISRDVKQSRLSNTWLGVGGGEGGSKAGTFSLHNCSVFAAHRWLYLIM